MLYELYAPRCSCSRGPGRCRPAVLIVAAASLNTGCSECSFHSEFLRMAFFPTLPVGALHQELKDDEDETLTEPETELISSHLIAVQISWLWFGHRWPLPSWNSLSNGQTLNWASMFLGQLDCVSMCAMICAEKKLCFWRLQSRATWSPERERHNQTNHVSNCLPVSQ